MKGVKFLTSYLIIGFLVISLSLQINELEGKDFFENDVILQKESFIDQSSLLNNYHYKFNNKLSKISSSTPLSTVEINRVLKPTDSFYIGNADYSGYDNITAELIFETANAYFYVQSEIITYYGSGVNTKIGILRDYFEDTIFGNVTLNFGNIEGQLGNIGDGKVIILVCYIPSGAAGYFSGVNEYSQAYLNSHGMSNYKSNEWEMFYYDYNYGDVATIAHELQHLIQFNHKSGYADRWFDEGCSQLAEYLSYVLPSTNFTGFEDLYFRYQSDDSLIWWNYWSEGSRDVRIDYGGAYTFVFYLYEQLGLSALNYIINDTLSTVESLSNLLAPYNMTFNDFFLNWQVTLLIDDLNINPSYGFQNLEFTVDSLYTIDKSKSVPINAPYYGYYTLTLDYSRQYYETTLNFESDTTIGYVAIYKESDTIVKIEKGVTSNDSIIFPYTENYSEILVSLALVEDIKPSISGDFGLGDSTVIDIEALNPYLLFINTPTIQKDGLTINISDLEILFPNGTSILEGSAENTVSIKIYDNYGFSQTFSLTYDLSIYNGWGTIVDLSDFEVGSYYVSLIVSSSDYFYTGEVYNFYITNEDIETTSWTFLYTILPFFALFLVLDIRRLIIRRLKK